MSKTEAYKDAEAWLFVLDKKVARIQELKQALAISREMFVNILNPNPFAPTKPIHIEQLVEILDGIIGKETLD